jgi:hypothetical protein
LYFYPRHDTIQQKFIKMNIYLTNTFNQLKQFIACFPKDSLPIILVKDVAFLISGWSATARIVDHISKNHPFVKEIKTPISVVGAISIVLLSHISVLSAAGTIAILAAIAFGSTKAKMTYSPEDFKGLLLQKHLFPPNIDIIVTGNLDLSCCTTLTSLPKRLTVEGDLILAHCTELTSLPEGLAVGGDINLGDCTGLTSLPKGLTVRGHLILFRCTELTSLPEGLTVGGDLFLCDCTGLPSLPEGLIVRGNLDLSRCTGLPSLPEGLIVGGNLGLSDCTGITSLPGRLTVGGNLHLSGCTGLTSLPNWVTTLGPLANGDRRGISLERMGLSQDLLTRLRETDAPGIRFYLSNAASVPTQIFLDLDIALTFWVKATNDVTLTNPPITIDLEMDLRNVLTFLSRLTETAEYKNPQARPMLAKRVIEVFSLMAEDEDIKGRAFVSIHHGLSTCDDRIISALEQIELMVLLHKIANTSHTEDELRALGKRFLLLEMVNEKAKAHKNTLKWVDEIEIYLAFQIGLAEKLNLPVKTRNMIFRRCAQITDEQINQVGDAVVRECTEEKLNNFLESWSPWIEHQKKNSSVPAYENLPVVDRKLEKAEICPITQDIPEKPVLYGRIVYDYDEFIQCYRTSGINPVDRSKIDLGELKRIVTSAAVSSLRQ